MIRSWFFVFGFFKFSFLLIGGVDFPKPTNTESTESGDPTPAEEAAGSFRLPDGFQVNAWASEPEVQNPIAMAWDDAGQMWVAENYTYAKRSVRFDLSLRDRVVVLADKDGDGQAEFRKVFTDQVQRLTSVEVGHGGVWLMCPPKLLFIPDRDNDLVPDGEPQVILDGFDVARGNYHNFANGLRWGPDGWLYGRCGHSCPGLIGTPETPREERIPIDGGIWRYHPKRKRVEVLTHGTVNPWGYDWDEHGELFYINTVIGHLWHMIPGMHNRESSGSSQNPLVYERGFHHADHLHYDTNLAWHKSRDGAANDYGGGHAHVGMAIYQADHFPQYWRNKLLTWNQHGKRMNVERLDRVGSGYVGRHEPDVFLSGDDWFRGMEVSIGPGGAIFGLDWSDTGECHDFTGVHRTSGRIYKFFYEKNPISDLSLFNKEADHTEEILRHSNAWYFRQWLVALAGSSITEPNKEIQVCENTLGNIKEKSAIRLRALWGLNAMGSAKPESLLNDPDEHIRTWAVRLLTDEWPIDLITGPATNTLSTADIRLEKKFKKMAKFDTSALVRLALASTLQRVPIPSRISLARELVRHRCDAEDKNLPSLVWYGITPMVKADPMSLVELAWVTEWPDLRRWIARSLTEQIKEKPRLVEEILNLAMEQPKAADSLLEGMERALLGMKGFSKPSNWSFVDKQLNKNPRILKLSVLFGDQSAMDQMEALALDGGVELKVRREALNNLIESGRATLRGVCEQLLDDEEMALLAVRGLAKFSDIAIGKRLAMGYPKFNQIERSEVIEVLCGRTDWANELLDQVESGQITKNEISAFHTRQLQSHKNEKLSQRVKKIWGAINQTSHAMLKRSNELRKELNPSALAKSNLSRGRVLYEQTCSDCHVLYGKGGQLGPDLTGSGRASLDYLLENLVDPSAVVPKDYQLTILKLKDGRILSGMEFKQGKNSLVLRMPGSETVLAKAEVISREVLPFSLMPAGLLDSMNEEKRRDLIAYLMNPKQIALPVK